MSFLGQFKAMSNPDVYGRVWMAMYKIADNVINEDKSTPNHPQREALAEFIQIDPEPYAGVFVKKVVFNPSISTQIADDGSCTAPDGDIEFTVAGAWDLATAQLNRPGRGF
jgi:hypothetical protein